MLQQHFSNISNYKNPSKHETVLALNNTPFFNCFIDSSPECSISKCWGLHSLRQKTKSQIFFWPSKPWHEMHLNVLPSLFHSSGMTNLGTVWQVWSCMLHRASSFPWGRAQGSLVWSDIAAWLGGHADPVINRLGPSLHCAEPTKAQTQCILMGWR